jgi:chromosome segregation ATPase
MRPAEVTTTQIIIAGIQLEKCGKAVNGFSLRKQIGAGNPTRLKRVWDESAATRGEAQNESPAIASGEGEGITSAPEGSQVSNSTDAEVAALRDQVQALQSQLEAAKKESANLSHQVQQVNLVVDAVTDDRNKFQLRCAELEGKDKSHRERIVELNARIDEQRGELHRGSQARITLQKALDALLPKT